MASSQAVSLDVLLDLAEKGERIPAGAAEYVVCAATRVLRQEPNVVRFPSDHVTVFVGDVCGDAPDLVRELLKPLFGRKARPSTEAMASASSNFPSCRLVFLGNYVGTRSMGGSPDLLVCALALKLSFPDHVTLLRGFEEGMASGGDLDSFTATCFEAVYGPGSSGMVKDALLAMPLAALVTTGQGRNVLAMPDNDLALQFLTTGGGNQQAP